MIKRLLKSKSRKNRTFKNKSLQSLCKQMQQNEHMVEEERPGVDDIERLRTKFGIKEEIKLNTGGIHIQRSNIEQDREDDKHLRRYRTRESQQSIQKQKRFGAEYMLSGNALPQKDLNVLSKHAGITLNTSQLGRSYSRKSLKHVESPMEYRAKMALADQMKQLLQLESESASGTFNFNV